MTLRRLPETEGDFQYELSPCVHPEHEPPTHVVLEPGRWEHRCPSCHRTLRFTVPRGPVCHGFNSAPPVTPSHAGVIGGSSAPVPLTASAMRTYHAVTEAF